MQKSKVIKKKLSAKKILKKTKKLLNKISTKEQINSLNRKRQKPNVLKCNNESSQVH